MSTPWPPEEDARFRAAVDGADADAQSNGRPSAEEVAYRFTSLADFASRTFPDAEPLLGKRGAIYLAVGSLLLVYGPAGAAKSTWTIDGACHLAAGRDWLGVPVPRPAHVLLIENEGPPGLYQSKLDAKRESWDGPDFTANTHVYTSPWSAFTFADPRARETLTEYCDEHEIDVVMANPTLGLGVAASGRPDETQQFVDWLKQCGLGTARAYWIIHHENKAGQISGDWGRHPDTTVLLQRDGNRQRTRLTWEKTRWATLEPQERAVMFEWVPETEGYAVTPLDAIGASDELLIERLVAHVGEHPATATKYVCKAVEGSDARLTELLNDRPEFDFVKGDHGAKLWTLASTSAEGPE